MANRRRDNSLNITFGNHDYYSSKSFKLKAAAIGGLGLLIAFFNIVPAGTFV